MRFTSIFATAAVIGGSVVSAQNASFVEQILGALTAANLTSLAGAAQAVAGTPQGGAFLAMLAGSNKTLLAPSNDAFAAIADVLATADNATIASILSYHVLNSTFTSVGMSPNHTIVPSLYMSGGLSRNATSPVVLTSTSATNITIPEANGTATVLAGPISAANFMVYVIDTVLSLPSTLTELATSLFPSLAGVITQVGLLAPLEASKSITVFAPNDAAISAVLSVIGTLNTTQITTVLANHVINGTVAYSTLLGSGSYVSAAGEPFTFMTNSSGTYVSSGMSMARVVQSDIIIANGVVHIIDAVLANTASNASAAAAAVSSAMNAPTAVASGPIGTASARASSAPASSATPITKISMVAVGSVLVTVLGVAAGAALL